MSNRMNGVCSNGSEKHVNGFVPTKNGFHSHFEPIAVVGVSCEFSGGVTDTQSFWDLLKRKEHGMKEWPKERINLDSFYNEDGSRSESVGIKDLHVFYSLLTG